MPDYKRNEFMVVYLRGEASKYWYYMLPLNAFTVEERSESRLMMPVS